MNEQWLEGMRVAALAADGFEQIELTVPMKRLRKRGAQVDVISLRPGKIQGMNAMLPGKRVRVDQTVYTADPDMYDALLIPGGHFNPDFLRQSEEALDFVRRIDMAGKPIAVICHAPWVLISAGLVQGRRLTSWHGIKDDVMNAGGLWEDREVVLDGNWLSSRGPQDLKAFFRATVQHFAAYMPVGVGTNGWGEGEMETETMYAREESGGGLPALPGLVIGGLALAGVGYLATRLMLHRSQETETTTLRTVQPPTGELEVEVELESDDATLPGYAGGYPHREGMGTGMGMGMGTNDQLRVVR